MDELGKHFWSKTVGLAIGRGVLGLIGRPPFTGLVARFGVIAALVIIFAMLMAIAYRADKRKQREYERLDSAWRPLPLVTGVLPRRPDTILRRGSRMGAPRESVQPVSRRRRRTGAGSGSP